MNWLYNQFLQFSAFLWPHSHTGEMQPHRLQVNQDQALNEVIKIERFLFRQADQHWQFCLQAYVAWLGI